MKFSQTWLTSRANICNDDLYRSCLVYKIWKKRAKTGMTPDVNELLELLKKDLTTVNRIFEKWLRVYFPKGCAHLWNGCLSSTEQSDKRNKQIVQDLHNFCALHKQCFYKITKRLDKRLCTGVFKKWYVDKVADLKCSLLGHFWIKRLEIEMQLLSKDRSDNGECPLCLEEVSNIAILACGHTVCVDCLKQVHSIKGKKGTLFNIIGYNINHCHMKIMCPVCRCTNPYKDFDKYHVVPEALAEKLIYGVRH